LDEVFVKVNGKLCYLGLQTEMHGRIGRVAGPRGVDRRLRVGISRTASTNLSYFDNALSTRAAVYVFNVQRDLTSPKALCRRYVPSCLTLAVMSARSAYGEREDRDLAARTSRGDQFEMSRKARLIDRGGKIGKALARVV